jgi:hypothetical protein
VEAPDFQSGGAGFQTRGNAPTYELRALALVAASQAVCDFFRPLRQKLITKTHKVQDSSRSSLERNRQHGNVIRLAKIHGGVGDDLSRLGAERSGALKAKKLSILGGLRNTVRDQSK